MNNYTQLKMDKITLMTLDDIRFAFDVAQDDLIKKAMENIVEQLRSLEPNTPDNVLYAFVRTFFDFKLDKEYDLRNKSFIITVNPIWKSQDMIDTESDDYKLLDKICDELKELEND